MSSLFAEQNIKAKLEKAFGTEMTADQLWALSLFAKRVRTYARHNTAFNNLGNRLFPHARFQQVTKTRLDGTTYPGLQIVVKETVATSDESETE
jgi:hypothetical protein